MAFACFGVEKTVSPSTDLQQDNFSHAPAVEKSMICVLAGGITLHYWDFLLVWLPFARFIA